MSITAPPGVFDILPVRDPDSWKYSLYWEYVEKIARNLANIYGYREIRTPIFEREELFKRSIGDETDIVSKEMYVFTDRGDRRMALRPEGTAPAMRAVIEHQLYQQLPQKLFYIAPMFRYERQQAGRYRQHHQFGVEAIGPTVPSQDVEAIDLLLSFYKSLGLKDLTLNIHTIGGTETRQKYRSALIQYLSQYKENLSSDSQKRLENNPLRILDSKDEGDQLLLENAPKLMDFLNEEEKKYFDKVCDLLSAINISYVINHRLVRGLDYYQGVVFEVTSSALGSQNSIGGGGRYDGLLKQLGGPDIGSFGFGCGLERVIHTMIAQDCAPPAQQPPILYMIPMGDAAQTYCFTLLHKLREKKMIVQMEFSNRKLAKSMQHANNIKARCVAVVGENELANSILSIKHMDTGEVTSVPLGLIEDYLGALP